MTGRIIKGVGGFYYISCMDEIYTCRGKGILRKDGIKPLIGDIAVFSETDHEKKKEA